MATTAQVTTGNDKGRKNEIGGFWVACVDRKVMLEFVDEQNIDDIDPEGDNEQIAVALSLHFKGTTPKSELCKCTECGGESPVSLEACPFCGDAEAIEDEGDSDDEEDGDDDAQPITEEEDEQPIDRVGDEVPTALVSSPELSDDDGPEGIEPEVVVVEPPPAAKPEKRTKAKEKPKMELVHTNGANGASTKRGAAAKAIVKATTASLSAIELDTAVDEVKKLKTEGAVAYWTLGHKITEINKRGLWKLRMNEQGKSAYKSFEQFVHHELNMSASAAYAAIDVAREYTIDQVREIGSNTKAVLLLKVPAPDRARLTEQSKNMTSKQLRQATQESRAKHGSPKKDKQHSAAGKKGATSSKRESAASDKISVTSIVGSKTIKLHKKPASMKGIDATTIAELPRAKKLTDQPYGAVEMANGVVQYFSILQKDGDLVLKIETRRKE